MCICCSAATKTVIRNVLPHYSLVTPTISVERPDRSFLVGQFGLVRANDPDFIFPMEGLTADPYAGKWGEADENDPIWDDPVADEQDWKHTQYVRKIEGAFVCDPCTGYYLIADAIEAGYRAQEDGDFVSWFVDRIARRIAEIEESGEDQEWHSSDVDTGRNE